MKSWHFYGRRIELTQLRAILNRQRWFFAKITGRRRIGKTTLIGEAMTSGGGRKTFYVQIPDSGDAGVLSAVSDALNAFEVEPERHPRPRSLSDLAKLIEGMARDGYVVVLDEFQYFNHRPFAEFCSALQAAVDRLSSEADLVRGGLIVSGSIHAEMTALLEDRSAPLYNRVTDSIKLDHLDIGSVSTIIRNHADPSPERLLFLWNLFEGVPKYYRDCYEEGVLAADRKSLLRRIFFDSSSPLRDEADGGFMRELRGQYDIMLKFVARYPGRPHGELVQAIREQSGNDDQQIGKYLKILIEKYRLISRKQPVFTDAKARQGRYYLTDNFLQAWLAALANQVIARNFQPIEGLVERADRQLETVEGYALERLAGQLYEERSRKGLGDFPIDAKISGYWNRQGIEIDLVAIRETDRVIRFGSCKRSPAKLLSDVTNFRGHVARYLEATPRFSSWTVEHVGIAPRLNTGERAVLERYDVLPQDLDDLTRDLD